MGVSILVFALVVIICVALALYGVQRFAPVEARLKQLIQLIIVVIGVLLILGRATGL